MDKTTLKTAIKANLQTLNLDLETTFKTHFDNLSAKIEAILNNHKDENGNIIQANANIIKDQINEMNSEQMEKSINRAMNPDLPADDTTYQALATTDLVDFLADVIADILQDTNFTETKTIVNSVEAKEFITGITFSKSGGYVTDIQFTKDTVASTTEDIKTVK